MKTVLKRIEVNNFKKCRECGGNAIHSKGMLNSLVSYNDFGGDVGDRGTTQSRSGKARMVNCLKCKDCGHSWVTRISLKEVA